MSHLDIFVFSCPYFLYTCVGGGGCFVMLVLVWYFFGVRVALGVGADFLVLVFADLLF